MDISNKGWILFVDQVGLPENSLSKGTFSRFTEVRQLPGTNLEKLIFSITGGI